MTLTAILSRHIVIAPRRSAHFCFCSFGGSGLTRVPLRLMSRARVLRVHVVVAVFARYLRMLKRYKTCCVCVIEWYLLDITSKKSLSSVCSKDLARKTRGPRLEHTSECGIHWRFIVSLCVCPLFFLSQGANIAVPTRACCHFGAVRQGKRATNVPVSTDAECPAAPSLTLNEAQWIATWFDVFHATSLRAMFLEYTALISCCFCVVQLEEAL